MMKCKKGGHLDKILKTSPELKFKRKKLQKHIQIAEHRLRTHHKVASQLERNHDKILAKARKMGIV